MGGGEHDAVPIPAVGETEGMAQFVKGRLFSPFPQKPGVRGFAIELWTKPVDRDEGTTALDLCQAKDIPQYRHVEVHRGHPDDPKGILGTGQKKAIQDEL